MHDSDFYKSKDVNQALGHFIEEASEALAASGKIIRFGWFSVNPEISRAKQETNLVWLRRELEDVKMAIEALEDHIEKGLIDS